MWLGKENREKEKLSSLDVTKKLDDLFVVRGAAEELEKMKDNFSIEGSTTDLYLCLASLFVLAFMKVFQSNKIQVKQAIISKIFQNLTASLVAHHSNLAQPSREPQVLFKRLKQITESLLKIWTENREKASNPQWYVGKEVCYLLNGRNRMPNPTLVMRLANSVSNDIADIKALFKDLEKKYLLIK